MKLVGPLTSGIARCNCITKQPPGGSTSKTKGSQKSFKMAKNKDSLNVSKHNSFLTKILKRFYLVICCSVERRQSIEKVVYFFYARFFL